MNNFFDYATKEISHSAFWAWTLNCADQKNQEMKTPVELANKFIKNIYSKESRNYEEVNKISVKTEYCPEGTSRKIDILVTINDSINIVIENKLNAIPGKEQLNKYYKLFDDNTLFVFMNLGYDYDFQVPAPWIKFTIEDISRLFENLETKEHFLVREYYNWLKKRKNHYKEIEEGVFSLDMDKVEKSLSKSIGQWSFFKALFNNFSGIMINGKNRGGTKQTQFRFFGFLKKKDPFPCALFYRVDKYTVGYYLSIRQYLNLNNYEDEKNDIKAEKKEELKKLRSIWKRSVEKITTELESYKTHNKGKSESEVGCFIINKQNHPKKLKKLIPEIHKEFIKQLEIEGWPINTERGDL